MSRPMAEPLEVRKERILNSARTALMERGYQDVVLDDVARRAKLAKGTLYLYFKDKEDLFVAVFDDLVDRLEQRIENIDPSLSGKERLLKIAEEKLVFIDENFDFLSQACGYKSEVAGTAAFK